MNRLLLLLVLGACGSSSITSNNDAPIVTTDIDAKPQGPCTRVSECPPGNICNPADGMCVTSLPCTTHADCGGEAYCTPGGMCAPSVPHGPCDNDQNCIGQEACNLDTHICGCGGQALTTEIVTPNVLIAIDRSDSMNAPACSGCDSKWNTARAAVGTIVDTYGAQVRFGLDLWPGVTPLCDPDDQGTSDPDVDCSGGAVHVDVGVGTATGIKTFLNDSNTRTCNLGTPIANSLTFIAGYSGLEDTTRNNYVLFMTDGTQNACTGNFLNAADALRTSTPPVLTYVVGFGSGVSTTQLNNLADHGGTARPGDPRYYQADNPADLLDAFRMIVGEVLSCSFTLSSQPNDPGRLFVYFGTTQVPRDMSHTSGWDYDATSMQLTFYGTTCDQVRAGTAGNLAVSYGCPIIP